MKAYVSGPLTSASNLHEARRFYEALALVCEECGWEVFLPHHQTDPKMHAEVPAVTVYLHDRKALDEADLIIAQVGFPSLGVGAEIGIAFMKEKRIVGIHPVGATLSRFVTGMLTESRASRVFAYRSQEECLETLRLLLLDWEDRPNPLAAPSKE